MALFGVTMRRQPRICRELIIHMPLSLSKSHFASFDHFEYSWLQVDEKVPSSPCVCIYVASESAISEENTWDGIHVRGEPTTSV